MDWTCMCGDTCCPSCGPAQGYCVEEQEVAEWIEHLMDKSEAFDLFDAGKMADAFMSLFYDDRAVCEAMEDAAGSWSRKMRQKVK